MGKNYNLTCTNCGTNFVRNTRNGTVRGNVFCNKSCAATYNNKKYPKRARESFPKKQCERCGLEKRGREGKYCKECRKHISAIKLGESKTVADCGKSTYHRHRFQGIRNHAKRMADNVWHMERKCAICEYSVYVELCHITPISHFDPDTTWNTVNSLDNLKYLCPNHHKEFDRGLINNLT